jgi:hypothetical protein
MYLDITRCAFLLTMFLLSLLFGSAYAILADRNLSQRIPVDSARHDVLMPVTRY